MVVHEQLGPGGRGKRREGGKERGREEGGEREETGRRWEERREERGRREEGEVKYMSLDKLENGKKMSYQLSSGAFNFCSSLLPSSPPFLSSLSPPSFPFLPPSFLFFLPSSSRPPLLMHDHCYASGIQVRGDMPQDSLGGCEPERHHTTDGRRCVLCSVEGDAEPMVSTTSRPKSHHWCGPFFTVS